MGFASETSSDSDADDEFDSDTSGEPLAKRQYSAGIATGVTAAAAIAQTSSSDDSDDERLSTSTNSSDGESAAATSSPTPAEKKCLKNRIHDPPSLTSRPQPAYTHSWQLHCVTLLQCQVPGTDDQ